MLMLAAFAAPGQLPGPANVSDCRPCTFSPGKGLPSYSFTFDLKKLPDGRAVEAIRVARDSQPLQRLPVTAMPIGKDEPFFFGGVDVNFDGFLDLMIITRRGAANAYAQYWIFDSATSKFAVLGVYPVFRIDAQKHRLSTYERGGFGGLAYESKEYSFSNGKLVLMRDEKQSATSHPDQFRKVIRERIGGAMKTTKTESVKAPE
jgi:hypothetical protein